MAKQKLEIGLTIKYKLKDTTETGTIYFVAACGKFVGVDVTTDGEEIFVELDQIKGVVK
jgi:hypothetical protein